jgi:pyruvate/2-oxoglutarate dehydrogenase complex dihydrolipoamide dehydrogenase (E3) component
MTSLHVYDADPGTVQLSPMDDYNRTLLENVHPSSWANPSPQPLYDLVVIGAGTAGLVTAKGAAGLGLGLKVALIEKHLMGGDCLNVGCVPSKCLIRSSRVVGEMQQSEAFGVHPPEFIQVDFAAVMARMRRVRAQISPVDSARSAQSAGVDVFLGSGRFTSSTTLSVAGQTVRFKKAVITTGARAVQPDLEGLAEVGFLTNETVFSLTQCPRRLAVIGGGPIGCELAQAFQRLGAEVVILEQGGHLLSREDKDAAEVVQQSLLRDGVQLALNCQLQRVERSPEGKIIHYRQDNELKQLTVDEILVGAGRAPNVEGLNLEVVGVEYGRQGVKVNDYLQTTNPKIYAAGDICMAWKFTHAADAAARIVLKNTLFSPFGLGRSRLSSLVMPWTTYTDPEVAHVGLYETEARDRGIEVNTIKVSFHDVDRAIADGEEEGFVKIHHKKGSDTIVGATIVSRHAGETISEITTAMVHGIGLGKLASVIHPYPTQAEAIKKAADGYRRTLLTPRSRSLLKILSKLS